MDSLGSASAPGEPTGTNHLLREGQKREMDVFQKCAENDRVQQTRPAACTSITGPSTRPQDPVVTRTGSGPLIMLGSNNYLGLASHPGGQESQCRGVGALRNRLCRIASLERQSRTSTKSWKNALPISWGEKPR